MLAKFLRIYTWTVAVLIAVAVGLGLYYLYGAGQPMRAYLCFFLALLAVFILFVTRSMANKNLRRQDPDARRRRK